MFLSRAVVFGKSFTAYGQLGSYGQLIIPMIRVAQKQFSTSSGERFLSGTKYSGKNDGSFSPNDTAARYVDSLEGREIEFDRLKGRGNLDYSATSQKDAFGTGGEIGDTMPGIKHPSGDTDQESYQPMSNVSLYSVMQSSVPEPYHATPTHMHMPGGGLKLDDKLLSSHRQDILTKEHIKKYSTSVVTTFVRFYSEQHKLRDEPSMQGSSNTIHRKQHESISPEGVQGDNCDQYKLFLENCEKYGLDDCTELLDEVKKGDKTMEEAFTIQAERVKKLNEVGTQLSRRQKLKQAIKDYGSTVVVFHVGISLISLGGFYLAVSSGIDMVAILQYLGATSSLPALAGASTFVVAYAVHKVFAPVRITITLSATPFIVRYLRSIGILKPPKQRNSTARS